MNLITDRTKSDVLMGTEKGCYGAADLNRVEQAVEELIRLQKELLGNQLHMATKTDWGIPGEFNAVQWPTKSQMERYLSNVIRLCESVELAAGLPQSMDNLTWDGANQIEAALLAVYDRIQIILQNFQFSGEIFAGEENAI